MKKINPHFTATARIVKLLYNTQASIQFYLIQILKIGHTKCEVFRGWTFSFIVMAKLMYISPIKRIWLRLRKESMMPVFYLLFEICVWKNSCSCQSTGLLAVNECTFRVQSAKTEDEIKVVNAGLEPKCQVILPVCPPIPLSLKPTSKETKLLKFLMTFNTRYSQH